MSENIAPWYRQFWPWFLMSFPASAVIAGIATIIIAFHDPDGLVVDDYYKEGLAINQDIERNLQAAELNAQAFMRFNPDNKIIEVDLQLDKSMPEELNLNFRHTTRAAYDQSIVLTHQGNGLYRGNFEALNAGFWNINIIPKDDSWKLTGRINSKDRILQFTSS